MVVSFLKQGRKTLLTLTLRSIVFLLTFSLVFSQPISYAQQATVLGLPQPGSMVNLSPAYVPVIIKGIRVHQDNPLALDFIVDTGNSGLDLNQDIDKQSLSNESKKLIKYFLAALTLPEKDVWVNLSPYEKDRIIPAGLGQTEMGRDMLAQDYILKQITASLIYPEKGLGKDFWNKVYKESYQKFGTTQIPVNTFNKVWIVADKATVYENKDTAFVTDAHLKVMLEEDYLSLQKHSTSITTTVPNDTHAIGANIIRQIILPALEKEVNEGKNFANLRQIFHSLILAKWYKQALKQALINQVYSNRSKVAGVDVSDKTIDQKIYAQYLRAYKKGVFNFIKEDIDQSTQQPLPRKYFSGGVVGSMAMTVTHNPEEAAKAVGETAGKLLLVEENSLAKRLSSIDTSGILPAHLNPTAYQGNVVRLFRTDFSHEMWSIQNYLTSIDVKMKIFNDMETSFKDVNFRLKLEGAAANLFNERQFSDTDLIHALQSLLSLTLQEYLKAAKEERDIRLQKIGAYLQGLGFKLEAPEGGSIIYNNDTSKSSHVDTFLLTYYAEQLKKDADLEKQQNEAVQRQKALDAAFDKKGVEETVNNVGVDLETPPDSVRNPAMTGTWLHGSFKSNFVNVIRGTSVDSIPVEEIQHAQDIDMNMGFPEKVARARKFLEKESEVYEGTFHFKRVHMNLKYGYAIDQLNKIIYLSPKMLNKLRGETDSQNFDFFIRKIIFMSFDTPELGRKFEYEYAYEKYQERVISLFPTYSEPLILRRKIVAGILLKDINNQNQSDTYQKLAKEVLRTDIPIQYASLSDINDVQEAVQAKRTVVIEAGQSARKANEQILQRAEDSLYLIGVNALDGIADYRKGAHISTAQFSSKFNPITIAQTFITILNTYALSGSSSYHVNPSEFDPRKPDVFKSYRARLALAVAEVYGLFKNLVTLLKGDDHPDIKQWNGEEVAVIQASKIPAPQDGSKYLYVYTAGGDHHYVWAPEVLGLVAFDYIDNDITRQYYSFYAGIGEAKKYGNFDWKEYQKLVGAQIVKGNRKFYDHNLELSKIREALITSGLKDPELSMKMKTFDMDERKRVITAILEAKSFEDIEKVFKEAKVLPMLDTDGKMILDRKALPHIDFVLAHTIRVGANQGDPLRDYYIDDGELKVFNVDALNADIAATKTREGLIDYLFGIINFNLLYGASKETLKKVFDPKDREPLEILLRQKPLILPKSIPNMLNDDPQTHDQLWLDLQTAVNDVLKSSSYRLEEKESSITLNQNGGILNPGHSMIILYNIENTPLLTINYKVENTIDSKGVDVNKLISEVEGEMVENEKLDPEKEDSIKKLILQYIRSYNDIKSDVVSNAAMGAQKNTLINHTASPTGGIDLNANRMQLNVQKLGSGVGINFDPAMIKSFESGDFQGFVPMIINIQPINNIAVMLGIKEEEPAF